MPLLFRSLAALVMALALMLPALASASTTPSASFQLFSQPPLNPGDLVSGVVSASGFTNPSYAVSDSFPGSTVSGSDINNVGYFSWVPTLYDAGLHQITVTVTDTYGDSASATANVQIVSNAVLLQNFAPGSLVGTGHAITFSVVAPGFVTPQFTLSDTYPGTSAYGANLDSSGNFAWTPGVGQQGLHQFTVYARDVYGHNGSVVSPAVFVTNPQVSMSVSSANHGLTVGMPLTLLISSSGLATTTIALSDSFAGTSTMPKAPLAGGAFTWTPTATDVGLHTVTVTATDPIGDAASTTQTFLVNATSFASSGSATTPVISPTSAPTTSNSPSVATGDGYKFSTALGIGMSSPAVTELQKRLAALGIYSGPVTGYFGPLTAAAVRAFQAAHALSQVGSLGPLTRALLNNS